MTNATTQLFIDLDTEIGRDDEEDQILLCYSEI